MARRSTHTSQKPLIFISHASQEKDVALALKATLDNAFIGALDFFVSSDDTSITMGADFDAAIRKALGRADYGLCLFSPESLKRPWINIEFGALWYAGTPAVPVCFGGLNVGDLPSPYGSKNGLNATDERALDKLVANIADLVTLRVNKVDWTPFLTVVAEVNARAQAAWQGTPDELTVLKALYGHLHDPEVQDAHDPYFEIGAVEDASALVGLSPSRAAVAMELLTERGLLDVLIGHGGLLARLNTTQIGWYRYFQLTDPDFRTTEQRVIQAVVVHREVLDATWIAAELGVGYLVVATILQNLARANLLALTQSTAGETVEWVSHMLTTSPS